MPSAEKNSADKIRHDIKTAVIISVVPTDCTEEDILILEAFYLGTKRGYCLAKNEIEG